MVWSFLQDAFWSAVAAVGFAIMFQVPRHALPGCALAGALAHTARSFLVRMGLSLELATLLAATAVGFLSELLAIRLRMPRIVFSVPGVIPLIPGILAYQTMLGIFELAGLVDLNGGTAVDGLLVTAVTGIKTGLILIAIALGIIAPNLLFRRQKPVV
jgi:uncharacterized membrane protein YjjB (DUF3815 family)